MSHDHEGQPDLAMKISLCTTCMGRAHHLKQTLPRNLADSVDWSRPNDVEFVVLDYSSPDDLAQWITSDPALKPYLEAGILRFARSEGHTKFRHSHAKNMAHALATGDFVCNVDADNFVGFGFVAYLRAVFRNRPNAIVATNRLDSRLNLGVHKGSMGRIALSKANFDLLGGYDESARFKGWSGEDTDMVIRALRMFLRPTFIRERRFLRVVQHSDLDRVLLTECEDQAANLAAIESFDGTAMRPILKYVVGRAVAPRIANRGTPIGAGRVEWHGRRRSA
jgi:glycosyltransferase involved in cell wall biosynthesis